MTEAGGRWMAAWHAALTPGSDPALLSARRGLLVLLLVLLGAWMFAAVAGPAPTWPFSSILFLSPLPLLALVCALAVVSALLVPAVRRWIDQWTAAQAAGVLVVIAIIGALSFRLAAPYLPALEGDGDLSPAGRLRNALCSAAGSVLTRSPEQSAALVWWSIGVVYLVLGARIAWHLGWSHSSRLALYLLLVLHPGVANFCGHVDGYAVLFTGTVLAGLHGYLAVARRSMWDSVLAVLFLMMVLLEILRGAVILAWPLLLAGVCHAMSRHPAATARWRAWVEANLALVFGAVFSLGLLAGVMAGRHLAGSRGDLLFRAFHHGWRVDGPLAAMGQQLLLPIAFAGPFLLLMTCLIWTGRKSHGDPVVITAGAYGFGLLGAYVGIQSSFPFAAMGFLDWLSQTGSLGGSFLLLSAILCVHLRWAPGLVLAGAVSLFLTVPAVEVSRTPVVLDRVQRMLPGERSDFFEIASPYAHFGLHCVKMLEWGQGRGREDHIKAAALQAFRHGAEDTGYWKAYRALNLYFLATWERQWMPQAQAHETLERLLRQEPGRFVRLLQLNPGISRETARAFFADIIQTSERLLTETGVPVYAEIRAAAEQAMLATASTPHEKVTR